MNVEVVEGDITQLEVDAIGNAANNELWMGAGVAGAIKRAGGSRDRTRGDGAGADRGRLGGGHEPAETARAARRTRCGHGPEPAAPSPELIGRTTTAASQVADGLGVRSLALPAFGTGVGAVPVDECARAMVDAIRAFEPTSLERVVVAVYGGAALARLPGRV